MNEIFAVWCNCLQIGLPFLLMHVYRVIFFGADMIAVATANLPLHVSAWIRVFIFVLLN